jgi:hypothetical protein
VAQLSQTHKQKVSLPAEIITSIARFARQNHKGYKTVKALLLTNHQCNQASYSALWETVDYIRDGRHIFEHLLCHKNLAGMVKTFIFKMQLHNQGSPWHGYFPLLHNVRHFEVLFITTRNISLHHIFSTIQNCTLIQYLKLSTDSLPFHITETVLPLLGAHNNVQYIYLDDISIKDYGLYMETFLGPTQYSALKHILLEVDYDEPINSINPIIQSIPPLIVDSTSLTLLFVSTVPAKINLVTLLSALPALVQLRLGDIEDPPHFLPILTIPLLVNYHGPMSFLLPLIKTRHLKIIETWCGNNDTVTSFLKVSYGKMINKFSYRHNINAVVQTADDCDVINTLLHTRTTHMKSFSILACPGSTVSTI